MDHLSNIGGNMCASLKRMGQIFRARIMIAGALHGFYSDMDTEEWAGYRLMAEFDDPLFNRYSKYLYEQGFKYQEMLDET